MPTSELSKALARFATYDVAVAAATAVERAAARAEREGLVDVAIAPVATPIGELFCAATDDGLVAIGFEGAALEVELAEKISPRVLRAARRLDPVRRALDRYFASATDLGEVVVDWRLIGAFQRVVLERARAITPGTTTTYGALAADVGHPRAARAVGTALARNPIPIVLPCHRVVRAGGALGGYAGGLDRKAALLAHEHSLQV